MGHQQLYWSHLGKFGQGSRSDRHRVIREYGLNIRRPCFCPYAKDIGFIRLD
ncbi:small ribosomal subunit protein uS14-like [Lagenorhynchus albirostris]|uniref:small ribosomal subunit protein uS14-like n=1 Tax=Lagenorhynchus albirostris TaxID=27610 RepID=UPI0028E6BBDD|nr:small ribosomal subunit protein uS14-like [Lagenorhynchus albirostris]